MAAGLANGRLKNLLAEWRSRGWARKDAMLANAHVLTETTPHG